MTTWVTISRDDNYHFPYVFKVGERHFQLHAAPGSKKWELVEYKGDGSIPVLKTWNSNKAISTLIADAFGEVHRLTRMQPSS
jgi:hypothetical protein